MLRRTLFVAGAFLGVAMMVSPAMGVRNPAAKAGKYQATIVQGVEACSAALANTTAPGILSTPACDPVVPSDSGCVFGAKGKGKVAAKSKTDIAVQAKLGGLDATCDGETVCAFASVRTSTNNCASTGDCSTVPQPDLALGASCCTIAKGKCKIKTSINVALPGVLVTGNTTEFILGEIALGRTGQPGKAFRAGILLP